MRKLIGVIGAGNFGTAISLLLSNKSDVLLHSRRDEVIKEINFDHFHLGQQLPVNISGTNDLKTFCDKCAIIFIAIPSRKFKDLMSSLSTYLSPRHIIIHCVKGFELHPDINKNYEISPHENLPIRTMSEVLKRETNVVRIGCLSGPNLSSEILKGLPAATVIASPYDEVIQTGRELLDQKNFKVYGSHHLKGTEIAGALKNIVAIASGLVNGQNLGKNLEAIIITKGLHEMMNIGRSLDIDPNSFFGLAGIGDLIATATSPKSRNFSFGYNLGEITDIERVMEENEDLTEGITTTELIYNYCQKMQLECPIVNLVYDVIFNKREVKEALEHIYEVETKYDVDFY
ncbi:NAD(P)H-dependent glycerol-3-phosphate dehydrogenase [Membranihabitans maritimus]|uniref:NAD(P)H-dependent glycerol-3-phosphate dehydrogenase n=1 Tax=Membranihabitans maritimus TaxID=2904244 RepID=UPI001F012286|nr:NAD(P)H-dependent glycerol-3-phosphate dehydrogenase [Membranihabitans maritimus]